MKKFILVLIGILFLGCANSIGSLNKKSALNESKKAFAISEYKKVFKKFQDENKTDDLIWDYDAGTVGYYVKDYKNSVFYFDKAEDLIKKYDKEVEGAKLLANIGAILTNDTFMDYRPKIYDKLMVNTFKAIDFMSNNQKNLARVELNRALTRQKRAALFFKKEIALERKKINLEKRKNKDANFSIDKIVSNKNTIDVIEKEYTNLFEFRPYKDFVNPFVSYLAGIYFLNTKDYSKATELLKEAYAMTKGIDNGYKYVLEDFKLANNIFQMALK